MPVLFIVDYDRFIWIIKNFIPSFGLDVVGYINILSYALGSI
jgi:hypothetical protein